MGRVENRGGAGSGVPPVKTPVHSDKKKRQEVDKTQRAAGNTGSTSVVPAPRPEVTTESQNRSEMEKKKMGFLAKILEAFKNFRLKKLLAQLAHVISETLKKVFHSIADFFSGKKKSSENAVEAESRVEEVVEAESQIEEVKKAEEWIKQEIDPVAEFLGKIDDMVFRDKVGQSRIFYFKKANELKEALEKRNSEMKAAHTVLKKVIGKDSKTMSLSEVLGKIREKKSDRKFARKVLEKVIRKDSETVCARKALEEIERKGFGTMCASRVLQEIKEEKSKAECACKVFEEIIEKLKGSKVERTDFVGMIKKKDLVEYLRKVAPQSLLIMTEEKFLAGFKKGVHFSCEQIKKAITTEGLFRTAGNRPFQPQILKACFSEKNYLKSMPKEIEVSDSCDLLKAFALQYHLLVEVKMIKEKGQEGLEPSMKKINDLLKAIENSEENKMDKENIEISARDIIKMIRSFGFTYFSHNDSLTMAFRGGARSASMLYSVTGGNE